jgi:crotonobetainyl-CoA:carnitine CoA-transferase CaiB-like acyl-CoA transferase
MPAFATVRHAAEQSPDPMRPPYADEPITKDLCTIFVREPSAYWLDTLRPHGISVVQNVIIPDFRDDPYIRQAGLIVTRARPGRGSVEYLGTTAQLSNTPMHLGTPTPVPGGNTRELLYELRYRTADIEQYIAKVLCEPLRG